MWHYRDMTPTRWAWLVVMLLAMATLTYMTIKT